VLLLAVDGTAMRSSCGATTSSSPLLRTHRGLQWFHLGSRLALATPSTALLVPTAARLRIIGDSRLYRSLRAFFLGVTRTTTTVVVIIIASLDRGWSRLLVV